MIRVGSGIRDRSALVPQPFRSAGCSYVLCKADDGRVRIVVAEDLAERSSLNGHRFRSGLAEPNAVSLTCSRQRTLVALLFKGEIVALDRIPAQSTIYLQARILIGRPQRGGLVRRDATLPMGGVLPAKLAVDGIVRIGGDREADLCGCARLPTAAAGIHSGEGVRVVGHDQSTGVGGGLGRRTFRSRELTQELTVGGVAEIEIAMASGA